MVLFIVLVVVAMVSLAGFSFCALMSTENKAAHLQGDQLQLEQAVASGVEFVKALVAQPRQLWPEGGGLYDNPDLFRNVPVFDDPRTGRKGRFSVLMPKVEEGEITGTRFGVEDESNRLSLAALLAWERRWPGTGRQALLKLPGMTETAADSILDWMDFDDEPRQFGAETDYYASRNAPYGPRNTVPVSLEELLLVRGVTRALLFGADTDQNFQTDGNESLSGDERFERLRSGTALPWAMLLTVHSAERNLTPEGQPRINLNDPNLQQLYRRLSQVYDANTARFFIAYRQFGPYESTAPVPAGGNDLPINWTQPGTFRFTSVLDVIGARVRATASTTPGAAGGAAANDPTATAGMTMRQRIAASRQTRPATVGGPSQVLLTSPFLADLTAARQYLPRLLDYTTVNPYPVIRGRININQASKTVLSCLPGLDETRLAHIISAREVAPGGESHDHDYPTWLLTEGIVDLPLMKALLPSITTGGNVFRTQVVGYFEGGGPTFRAEVVVDATGPEPRQLYWKDLRALGRGFTDEVFRDPQLQGSVNDER